MVADNRWPILVWNRLPVTEDLPEKNSGVRRSTKRAVHHPVQEFKGVEYLVKKLLFFLRIQVAEVKKEDKHAKEILDTLYSSPRRALAHWYVRGETAKTTC